ncbi:MAG: acyltransferase [Epsilonproteobacteria bacterium 4484_65]|nr:MAG: acyltransferase [Epsilonproteobacteria bacterium 4484_65]
MISGKNEASPLLSIRNPLNKIRRYFSTSSIIGRFFGKAKKTTLTLSCLQQTAHTTSRNVCIGFVIALLSSAFIYLDYWDLSHPILTTLFGLTTLYLLLQEEQKTWFFSGFFSGLFWFWWISVSFKHYNMIWAIPIGLMVIALSYGILFWLIAWISQKVSSILANIYVRWVHPPRSITPSKLKVGEPTLNELIIKGTGLLVLSYIHPFGFDWFKPELMFVESYLGIEKWQFFIILISITLAIWKKQLLYLVLILLAYQPLSATLPNNDNSIQIITTHTSVKDKWNKSLHPAQFNALFKSIDKAIDANKTLVILPESVFPVFLNHSQELIDKLQERAKHISIVVGGLYWDGKTPRNSTYIFTNGKTSVANKVVLVPFGESNPLPDFLSDWVNKVFYDGAVDYKASKDVIDYQIDENTYRNAICFEATSEKLYEKNTKGERPKNMIALSNNGWFTPSIEPTQQKLLLQYYSKKYGTTIYHAVNMSVSYVIRNGKVEK